MNIITNEKLIRRNSRIAQFSLLGGLVVLVAGGYLFYVQPDNFAAVWGLVLLGFILSQVGIYYTNRFGRRPRPDELLNQALKGLSDSYSLYHYTAPTPHLLVGPAGLWVLMPRHQRGKITYEKGRWRQKGGGPLLAYMKIFGQEGLGRPDLEVQAEIDSVQRFLKKEFPEMETSAVKAVLIFTDPRAEIEDIEGAPVPAVAPKKLKDTVRKSAKEKLISVEQLELIKSELGEGQAASSKAEKE